MTRPGIRVAMVALALFVLGICLWLLSAPPDAPPAARPAPAPGFRAVDRKAVEPELPPLPRPMGAAEPRGGAEVRAEGPEIAVPGNPGGLPVVASMRDLPPEGERVDLVVDARGTVTVGGGILDPGALREILRQRADERRDDSPQRLSLLHAVLRVDRDLPWQGAQWLQQYCADPTIRIQRIHFGVQSGSGREGALPASLPVDRGPSRTAPGAPVEPGSDPPPARTRRIPPGSQEPLPLVVRIARTGVTRPSTPKDLTPFLEANHPALRESGFVGLVDAGPSVTTGEVVAVVDALYRWGMTAVRFAGARPMGEVAIEDAMAKLPPPVGDPEITVNGVAVAPR